jgi:hypothetical protein
MNTSSIHDPHDPNFDPIAFETELEITVLEPLTVEEESERLRLERKVERAFYEAGLALQTLRDKRLWRGTHQNFRNYCHDRFGFGKSAVYYLISAVSVVDNLKKCPQFVEKMPSSESQVRPLKALEPELQREAWSKAVARAGQKVPTAALVKEIVNQMQPKKVREVSPTMAKGSTNSQLQVEYIPLTKAQMGQKIRIKAHHGLFPLQLAVIVQIPNNRSVIVELEDRARELIDLKDLEMQRIVESNGRVTTPMEGPNRIPGMGLDWYLRVDSETFKALSNYAQEAGIATLGLAVKGLLERAE